MFILPLILPADTGGLTANLMDTTLLSLLTSVTILPLLIRFRRLASDSELALDITSEGYWDVTSDGRIVDVNSGYCQMIGYSREQILAMRVSNFEANESAEVVKAHLERIIANGHDRFETRHRHRNGQLINIEVSVSFVTETRHFICFLLDITERKKNEDIIHSLAYHDTLTQLPNRRMLKDRLGQAMAASKHSGQYGALMFLDLDNFKPLNDAHGHDVGDLLLIEVARRITNCVREMDTVARFGGDEFVVMLSELDVDFAASTAQANIVAEKIRSILADPYVLSVRHDGKADATVEHHCTSSIGVVLFIDHEAAEEDILKWADLAMYQAKDDGRNLIRFYEPH